MIEEEMESEFGSVIIDNVWQCQAGTDGFPLAASAQSFHGNYEQREITLLVNEAYLVVRNNVAKVFP